MVRKKTVEFEVTNAASSKENYTFKASGEVKTLEEILQMGFSEHDGYERVSIAGEAILTFNGRRCCTIKNKGLDIWYAVIIKQVTLQKLAFFAEHIDNELNRYNSEGYLVQIVRCCEENMFNLYNSQFEDKTVNGETFFYDQYEE